MRVTKVRTAAAFVAAGALNVALFHDASAAAPGVFPITVGDAERIAHVLRTLYAADRIVVDRASNSIVVFGSAADIAQMRVIVAQLDVKSPTRPQTVAIPIRSITAAALVSRLHALFPAARFSAGPNRTLLVEADPLDLAQIKDIVAAIDVVPTASPVALRATEAVKIQQARATDVARVIQEQVPGVRAVAGAGLVYLSGTADAVAQAKTLIAQVDQPSQAAPIPQFYRLRAVDAQSVADLLERSFPTAGITVQRDLNALTVTAPPGIQLQIASGIAQLDGAQHVARSAPVVSQPGAVSQPLAGPDGQSVEVKTLRAAIPAIGTTGGTTTAADIAQVVQSALARSAPGLHITVQPNTTQMVLTGTPDEIALGKELIDQLDVAQKLVVLDTEILEIDETDAKNLGLSVQTPAGATVPSTSTVVSELVPTPQPGFSSAPQFLGLLPFTRTGLSIGLQLNLLVQSGNARILADPRITTISGRTATIRAGDNITVQTQAGGGAGTVATTQLQTFQTGVSLDITPVIDAGNFVSLSLHPVVNNLSGYSNGIPQISTRDTQTTVGLQADQTLVIGGLIEDSATRTDTKIPLLGDLPLIGRAFRNTQTSHQRNELVIVVTPHIIEPGQAPPRATLGESPFGEIPRPQPLPTLPPGTLLPAARPLGFQTSRPLAASTPVNFGTPVPSRTPAPTGSGPARPLATPSAFAQANTFTYGTPPQDTFAADSDPPRIFFATLAPTVLHNNTSFTISAITSTNVTDLSLQMNSGKVSIGHTSGTDQWQRAITFNSTNVAPGQSSLTFKLIASKDDGTTQSIDIPVSFAR